MEGGKVEAVMAEGRGALTYSTYSRAMVRYNGLPLALAPVAQPWSLDASLTRRERKQRKFSRKRGEKTGQEQINQLEVCFSFQA